MKYKTISRFLAAFLSVCMLISATACSSQKANTQQDSATVSQQASDTTSQQTKPALTEESVVDIQQLVDSVSQDALIDYVTSLCGEKEISVGNDTTTLTSRRTNTEQYRLAAQYVYEFMENLGLDVTYQSGTAEKTFESGIKTNYDYTNVIAEKKGITNPEEVIILCAHLDSIALQLMSVDSENDNTESFNVDINQTPAPGADDNATGCAAVMHIAELLSQYDFNRTIRFCFFDTEEEGYVGSTEYVKALAGNTESIKAVVNLDMIGWEKDGKPVVSLVTQTSDAATYKAEQEIRQAFLDAIQNYGLSDVLIPASLDGEKGESDHISFWNAGIPAIHIIEDWDDYNPYSNQAEDVFENLNLEYYTNVVKAVIGAYANLAGLTK